MIMKMNSKKNSMPKGEGRPSIHKSRRGAALFLVLTAATLALGIFLTLAEASEPRANAGTLCVKPGGGNGCLASINAALAMAQENDTIQVAAGMYVENVLITQTVTLQGGWNSNFSIRNLNSFTATIVPADNTQSVVSIQGQFGNTSAVAPTLDGFVITGGRADLGSNHGGGLRIVDSNARIISNTIHDNSAFLLGGGVWVQRGAPSLKGNHIENNLTDGLGQDAHGGGVQLENSRATLAENVITGNVVSGTEAFGGGIAIIGTGGGQVTLMRNEVISNVVKGDPTDFGFGGGIAISSGQVQLSNSRFISNTASNGGAIFIGGNLQDCCNLTGSDNLIQANTALRGGGIFIGGDVDDCCQFSGTNTQIQGNDAMEGGGLYNDDQFVALRGGLVITNTAVADGGGLLISAGGVISLTNSAVIENKAGQDGGAIHSAGLISVTNTTVSGNKADGMGGGIANFDSAYLLNATVSDNGSPDGAGLMNANVVVVKNSLIAQNVGDNCLGGLFSLGHNLEDGGTCAMGHATDQNNTPPAMNSLADNGGGTSTHALMAGSPAIDAGDNAACSAVDQRGAPRPVDGDGDGMAICDIGAYEYGAQLPWVYLPLILK